MQVSDVFLRYSYPNNRQLRDVEISAIETETGNVLGTIKANLASSKSYSGSKLPSFYIDQSLSNTSSKFTKPHMYVEELFVEEGARNRGIGTRLINAVVGESVLRNCDGRVVVSAAKIDGRSPLPFYRKMGFKTGLPTIDRELLTAAKYKTPYEKVTQAFMSISSDAISAIKKGLKFIR